MKMSPRSVAGAVVWVIAVGFASGFTFRGWIPHDEGMLGLAAERAAAGELPHVDFGDPYTGALSLLHAVAFEILGERLVSLRLTLLLAFALVVPIVYWIALRFAKPLHAAIITMAAIAWSTPVYFAALPSWYNLFLAIASAACLMKAADQRLDRPRVSLLWLGVAGAAAGVSILFKIVGLYAVLAGVASVFYMSRTATNGETEVHERAIQFSSSLFAASVFVFLAFLIEPTSMNLLHFIFPGAAVAALVLGEQFRSKRKSLLPDGGLRPLLVFLAGVALPVFLFVLLYLPDHMGPLLQGVFVTPRLRLQEVIWELPPLWTALFALPAMGLFPLVIRGRSLGRLTLATLTAVLISIVALGFMEPIYRAVWWALRPAIPVVVIGTCFMLWRHPWSTASCTRFILASALGFHSIIQYPYAHGIYFAYTAPLLVLLVASLFDDDSKLRLVLVSTFLLFAVLWVDGASPREIGIRHEPSEARHLLLPNRAGIYVSERHAEGYSTLVNLIRARTERDVIWAGADAPEVYFLSGKKSPFSGPYELFEEISPGEFMAALERAGVDLVVVNSAPEFSSLDPELYDLIRKSYHDGAMVGPYFVLWK